jgi:hypothetical protein
MDPGADALVARRSVHDQLEQPPGVVLGVLRLPLLDPILDDVEVAGRAMPRLAPEAVVELERLAELLSREILGAAPEALVRRVRIVELRSAR